MGINGLNTYVHICENIGLNIGVNICVHIGVNIQKEHFVCVIFCEIFILTLLCHTYIFLHFVCIILCEIFILTLLCHTYIFLHFIFIIHRVNVGVNIGVNRVVNRCIHRCKNAKNCTLFVLSFVRFLF